MIKILMILSSLLLLSCTDYTYKKVSKNYFKGYKLEQINKNSEIKYYYATKDFGPPTNTKSIFLIESSGYYYKVNPKFKCDVLNDTILILQELNTADVNQFGNWIFLKRSLVNGYEEIKLVYDSIPTGIDENIVRTLSEGLYVYDGEVLRKTGELTEFTSMHQIKDDGIYYLTSPGVFYTRKLSIGDFK